MRRVHPDKTARASAIDGKPGLRVFDVGISCVNRRALLAFPSLIPASSDKARPHSVATLLQSVLINPSGALGSEFLYARVLFGSQWEFKEPPLMLAWYTVEQFGDNDALNEQSVYAGTAVGEVPSM